MHELAFRASVHAAAARNRTKLLAPYYAGRQPNGTDQLRAAAAAWTQRVAFTRGRQRAAAYSSDWRYACAAAAVSVAGACAVLPLYARWWALGRAPSLNPLETGVAMGASLLLLPPPPPPPPPGTTAAPPRLPRHRPHQQQQQQHRWRWPWLRREREREQVQQRQGQGQERRVPVRAVNSNDGPRRIVARLGARRVQYGAVRWERDLAASGRVDEDGWDADGGVGRSPAAIVGGGEDVPTYQRHGGEGADGEGKWCLRMVDVDRVRQRRGVVRKPRAGEILT